MNKEDFRAMRTRRFIKNAFLEILSNKPFQDITVKEITDRAQCNRNTFYLHYIDKYDLIDKLCAANIKILEESLYETYNKQYSSNMDWYADIAKICLDTIEADIGFYEIMLVNSNNLRFTEQLQELLSVFILASLNKIGKNSNRLEVEFSASGMVGIIKYWIANRTKYTKADVSKELYNLIIQLGSVIFE